MKKQSDMMLKKQIKMERSPFHKTRDMTAPKGSPLLQAQVSTDMFEDFMRYALQYNIEHPAPNVKDPRHNKANPLKHIVNEFLNGHALERKCFDDLHVIMLLSNPFDYHLRKSAVIGFVRHPEKFTKFRPFNVSSQRNYETGLAYVVEEFDKQNFDMLNLASFDREVLFNIPPSSYGDFDKVREHLQDSPELEGFDFDNAFFVMFKLNNYFDIMQDGVFVSEHSRDKHEGVIVLLDPFYKLERLIVRINWSYHDSALDIEFRVEDEGFFNMTLSSYLPLEVFREYWSITSGFMQADVSKLEMDLQHAKQSIETYQTAIAMKERQIESIKRKLDELKK